MRPVMATFLAFFAPCRERSENRGSERWRHGGRGTARGYWRRTASPRRGLADRRVPLGQFWFQHGHVPEGRRWLERAIDLAPDDSGAPLARLAHWLGVLLDEQGELEAGLRFLERSLAIWRELGDRDQQAPELNSLGITHRWLGHLDTARSMLEGSAAIAREIGSDYRLAGALTNLGQAESEAGNLDRAAQSRS